MKYLLRRQKRSRSIRVRLDSDNGIIVTAPFNISTAMIDNFVSQSEPWIERQKQRLNLRQMANPTVDWNEKIISLLGKLYRVEYSENSSQKVTISSDRILVSPVTMLESDMPKTVAGWLQIEAEKTIRVQVVKWGDKMNTTYKSIRFGQQKSRWGSCTSDNKLQFNWRLIHFPIDVIDYVVIHELAHTVHHDHSDNFWKLVEKFCPSYKTHKLFLKRQIITRI